MKSLYVKFTVTTIAIMLMSGLLSFMFSNFYYQQKLKPENDEKVTTIALQIAEYIEQELLLNLSTYLENIATAGYQLFLIDHAGTTQYYGDPFRVEELASQTKNLVLNGEVYHGIAQFPQETFVTGFFANELSNTIGVPVTYDDQQYALFMRPNIKLLFNEIHILFAWILVLAIALSVVFVLIGARFLILPISKLTAATNEIADGNFSVKLDIDREDELGKLATSFTYMSNQLAVLDDMKNEFISNISHDIQSPLSNIKGYSHLLEKNTVSESEKIQYIAIMNREINRLSNLTKQLLLLASLDRQQELLNKKRYLLSKQIEEVVLNYEWLIHEQDLMVSYTLPDRHIIGDPSLLYNVWDNLLSNAIKYNKPNGRIDLTLTAEDHGIVFCIQDSGIGFTDDVKARIFERFYREDSSRTKTVEGTGLGLSIVLSIVQLHDGHVKVDSSQEHGTKFTVYLPQQSLHQPADR